MLQHYGKRNKTQRQVPRAVRFTEAETNGDCHAAYVILCVSAGTWKPEGSFNCWPSPSTLRPGLLLLSAAGARLAGPQGSEEPAASSSLLPESVPELQAHGLPWLRTGSGERNGGPSTFPAGILSTQPLELIFNVCIQSFNPAR